MARLSISFVRYVAIPLAGWVTLHDLVTPATSMGVPVEHLDKSINGDDSDGALDHLLTENQGKKIRPMEFIDYDCERVTHSKYGIDWAKWVRIIEKSPARDYFTNSDPFMRIIDGLDSEEWPAVMEECPYGFAFFLTTYFVSCMQNVQKSYNEYEDGPYKDWPSGQDPKDWPPAVKREMNKAYNEEQHCYGVLNIMDLWRQSITRHPTRILFGTRWPFLVLIGARNLLNSLIARKEWFNDEVNCVKWGKDKGLANWLKLAMLFYSYEPIKDEEGDIRDFVWDPNIKRLDLDSNTDWHRIALRFVFHKKIAKYSEKAREECPMGYHLIEVLKAYTAATSESRFFIYHEEGIMRMFREQEPSKYLFSRWAFPQMFNLLRKTTRHKFHLDYTVDEILESRLTKFYHYEDPWEVARIYADADLSVMYGIPYAAHGNDNPNAVTTTYKGLPIPKVRFQRKLNPYVEDVKNLRYRGVPEDESETWITQAIEYDAMKRRIGPPWEQEETKRKFHPKVMDTKDMLKYLAQKGSQLHRNVLRVLMDMPDIWVGGTVCPKTGTPYPSPGFAYTTMVYGSTFTGYLPSFINRVRETTGKDNLVVFCFDDESYQACKAIYSGCVPGGTPGITQKFTIPWVLGIHGVDATWIDFDVYFVQDPTPFILEHQSRGGFEILISGSFAAKCICNGIVYFRATHAVTLWLVDVIHWMYTHPYEHDQKCFAGWLNYTEPITVNPSDVPRSAPLPKWDTLDPIKQFITAAVVEGNGWMSESWEDLVMFHFLHGDSDKGSELDSSGSFMTGSDLYADMIKSEEDPNKNTTLMEVFYGSDSTHEKRVRALLKSRQNQREVVLQGMTCGVIAYPLSDIAGLTNPNLNDPYGTKGIPQ